MFFFIFAFNFIHLVAIVLILSTDQGDLTQGVCLLAKFGPVMSITNFKKPNKHTPSVQSACTTTKTTRVSNSVRLGAHWCDFQSQVAP